MRLPPVAGDLRDWRGLALRRRGHGQSLWRSLGHMKDLAPQKAVRLSRRQIIRGLGAAAVFGLPGCNGAGDPSAGTVDPSALPDATVIDGYTDQQSYRPGDRVIAYLNGSSKDASTNLDGDIPLSRLVLRDMVGRAVFVFAGTVFRQTAAGLTPWESGFGYQPSAVFTVPNLPSGVYRINGVVPVIVKTTPTESAEIVIVVPTNTVAAYNTAGGKSMYVQPSVETVIAASPIVSFLRPVIPPKPVAPPTAPYFYNPFLQWLATQRRPYSVRFIADIDMDDDSELYGAKLLMVIGHSEYWTRRARENFDAFVLRGGNALVLSGNTMCWQVRYSEDRTQLICYKYSDTDPIADSLLKTIQWYTPSLQYPVVPSIGADWAHGGYGIEYPDKGWKGYRILTRSEAIFRGADIAVGDVLALPTSEYDGAPIVNSPVTTGAPQLDYVALDAYKAEIIGYDYCLVGGFNRVATWVALQRTPTSGVIINCASTDWCSPNGVAGADGARVRLITRNMIEALINRQSVFTT